MIVPRLLVPSGHAVFSVFSSAPLSTLLSVSLIRDQDRGKVPEGCCPYRIASLLEKRIANIGAHRRIPGMGCAAAVRSLLFLVVAAIVLTLIAKCE